MADKTNRRNWIEVIMMPLAVALVGTLGTYFVTNEQRKSAEVRAAADREIRIIEIFVDKYTSENIDERVLAIGLTAALDFELSSKILTAIALDGEGAGDIKNNDVDRYTDKEKLAKAIENVTQRVITAGVSSPDTAHPGAKLEGMWLLRRQGTSSNQVVNWLEFKMEGKQLMVVGNTWKGDVVFDGTRGHYLWEFEDGRTGRTDIYLDSSGTLFGRVKGGNIDWTYWATRKEKTE